jgi:hypothetical protein
LLCLLRTSQLSGASAISVLENFKSKLIFTEGSRELDYFNASFVAAWKETHNYKIWAGKEFEGISNVPTGHPFAGQLSMADMKLRLAQ